MKTAHRRPPKMTQVHSIPVEASQWGYQIKIYSKIYSVFFQAIVQGDIFVATIQNKTKI